MWNKSSDCLTIVTHQFEDWHLQYVPTFHEDFERCQKSLCNEAQPAETNLCPPFFDGKLCWSYGSPGINRHACAEGYSGYAFKECIAFGDHSEWYTNENNMSFTNFANCIPVHEHNTEPFYIFKMYFTLICFFISLISSIAAFGIFARFRSLHCTRNYIHMNFFISTILFTISWSLNLLLNTPAFFMVFKEENSSHWFFCRCLHFSMEYSLSSNVFWMLCEGLNLYKVLVTNVFKQESSILLYLGIGWVMPGITVGAYCIFKKIFDNDYCWKIDSFSLINIVNFPLFICIVINTYFMIHILTIIYRKMNNSSSINQQYTKTLKATLILFPLLGTYNFIDFIMPPEEGFVSKILMIFYQGLLSLQGFFVALLYCFLNSEVKANINRCYSDKFASSSAKKNLEVYEIMSCRRN